MLLLFWNIITIFQRSGRYMTALWC